MGKESFKLHRAASFFSLSDFSKVASGFLVIRNFHLRTMRETVRDSEKRKDSGLDRVLVWNKSLPMSTAQDHPRQYLKLWKASRLSKTQSQKWFKWLSLTQFMVN